MASEFIFHTNRAAVNLNYWHKQPEAKPHKTEQCPSLFEDINNCFLKTSYIMPHVLTSANLEAALLAAKATEIQSFVGWHYTPGFKQKWYLHCSLMHTLAYLARLLKGKPPDYLFKDNSF